VSEDRGRHKRAAAAIRLVAAGEIAPETALFLTVWPPDDVEQASAPRPRTRFSDEQRAHVLELVANGVSWAKTAESIGASKGLVGGWVRAGSLRANRLPASRN
jgi:hypothetical protein